MSEDFFAEPTYSLHDAAVNFFSSCIGYVKTMTTVCSCKWYEGNRKRKGVKKFVFVLDIALSASDDFDSFTFSYLCDVMQLLRVAQELMERCTHLRLCQCAHMWLYSAALQWAHWQPVLIALPYPFVVQACIHTVGINMSRRHLT